MPFECITTVYLAAHARQKDPSWLLSQQNFPYVWGCSSGVEQAGAGGLPQQQHESDDGSDDSVAFFYSTHTMGSPGSFPSSFSITLSGGLAPPVPSTLLLETGSLPVL